MRECWKFIWLAVSARLADTDFGLVRVVLQRVRACSHQVLREWWGRPQNRPQSPPLLAGSIDCWEADLITSTESSL